MEACTLYRLRLAKYSPKPRLPSYRTILCNHNDAVLRVSDSCSPWFYFIVYFNFRTHNAVVYRIPPVYKGFLRVPFYVSCEPHRLTPETGTHRRHVDFLRIEKCFRARQSTPFVILLRIERSWTTRLWADRRWVTMNHLRLQLVHQAMKKPQWKRTLRSKTLQTHGIVIQGIPEIGLS